MSVPDELSDGEGQGTAVAMIMVVRLEDKIRSVLVHEQIWQTPSPHKLGALSNNRPQDETDGWYRVCLSFCLTR